MNAKVKALWIAALKSGQYEQGTGALRIKSEIRGELFCCLGVLCEVAVKEGALPPARHLTGGAYGYGRGVERAVLPREVREWAELADNDGGYGPGENQRTLANDNDNGMTFEDIVRLIEKHF